MALVDDQPGPLKRFKIDMGDHHDDEEFDEDQNQNPFQIQVILDVLFKLLAFEEVKKCRLVSTTWNEVSTLELSRRPQKPIKFVRIEELDVDDKLGSLLQLNCQLFSSFSFKALLLSSPQIDTFLENFSPKFVEVNGEISGVYNHQVRDLCKFLINISRSVEVIKFKYNFNYLKVTQEGEDYVGELSSTPFQNLRKISYNGCYFGLKVFFYSLIGQNVPKLLHLKFGTISEDSHGSPAYMKEQFEGAGLMSKLQILGLVYPESEFGQEYLKLFTEFGQAGVLKLTKLKIKPKILEIFAPLIESQAKTLKILEISTLRHSRNFEPRTRVPFPSLENLTILQINYFSRFEANFDPINFSIQFPKLVEFRTRDIETFLDEKLGSGGDSVKSVKLLKNSAQTFHSNSPTKNFEKVFTIFPNLEFWEMDICQFYPSVPFRSQLRKVVIHCQLKDLYVLRKQLLQDAKKVELFVDCGSKLIDDEYYKNLFGCLMMKEFRREGEAIPVLDHYNRIKYYQKILERISQDFTSLHSVSFTFIGYKISEDFKRDFRSILPRCDFICSPFKSYN